MEFSTEMGYFLLLSDVSPQQNLREKVAECIKDLLAAEVEYR